MEEERNLTTKFNRAELPAEYRDFFNPADNIDPTIETPRLPQLTIQHQSQKFVLPYTYEEVPEFEAIIIDAQYVNAYWAESLSKTGDRKPPNCMSLDGKKPDVQIQEPQAEDCRTCPQAQFGSDEDGKGMACKHMRRLHLDVPGHILPVRLTCSPTSLKTTREYFTQLADKALPYRAVKTKFSLERGESTVYNYSVINLALVGVLPNPELLRIAKKLKAILATIHGQAVEAGEFFDEEVEEESPGFERVAPVSEPKNDIPF